MTPHALLIVPCYNESSRLSVESFSAFLEGNSRFDLLFVDDGSQDGTAALISRIPGARLLSLPVNAGKGEAVRQGVLAAGRDYRYVGFLDADLSTPVAAMHTFADLLDARPELDIITGARVQLCGRVVERNPVRHYFGRVLATAISVLLAFPVYDTQCGAKLFRVTPEWERLWQQPFLSRWLFDVEVLARSQQHGERPLPTRLYELPLQEWRDRGPTKVRARDIARVPLELALLFRRYRFSSPSRLPES